jgi:transposase InsO family protein
MPGEFIGIRNQGRQFASAAFTGMLIAAGARISMDGRGRWMYNVFIERLWRSLQHEDVYLKDFARRPQDHNVTLRRGLRPQYQASALGA